jgi:hypothetical protein
MLTLAQRDIDRRTAQDGRLGADQVMTSQEKWKAIQQGLKLTESTGEFLGKAFGPAIEAAGGLLGDQLRYWRARNLDRLAEKWRRHLQARGIDPSTAKSLSFSDAYRALDAASMEEDDDVQDLWARLLAGAMDPCRPTKIKKVYIDLLKSIGVAEALFLDLINFARMNITSLTITEAEELAARVEEYSAERWSRLSVSEQKTAIQNLIRLRCIAYNPRRPRLMSLFRTVRSSHQSYIEAFGVTK